MNKSNLFYYAEPWEIMLCVIFCSAFVFAILVNAPSADDEGVVVIDDVFVSYHCSSSGKSDFFYFAGESGRTYTVGARRGSCRNPKENHDYVGRTVKAYFQSSDSNDPFRLDIEGVDGYEGGITFGRAALAVLMSFCLFVFPFLVLLGSRKRKFKAQDKI